MVEIITKEISRDTMVENITIDSTRATMEEKYRTIDLFM